MHPHAPLSILTAPDAREAEDAHAVHHQNRDQPAEYRQDSRLTVVNRISAVARDGGCGRRLERVYPRPPLTLTLSPFAPKSATGRGDGVAPVVNVGAGDARPPLPVRLHERGEGRGEGRPRISYGVFDDS